MTANASVRNWLIKPKRVAPATFRIPIFFERFIDRAVERFIKLIQAITKINRNDAEKTHVFNPATGYFTVLKFSMQVAVAKALHA